HGVCSELAQARLGSPLACGPRVVRARIIVVASHRGMVHHQHIVVNIALRRTEPRHAMATRHLYLARHGAADAFGQLTETGHQQARLLGRRLADAPIDVVWHSPLPRAAASAQATAEHLPGVPVIEAPELVDHVPYVPRADGTPAPWAGFFDGYDHAEAAAGQ